MATRIREAGLRAAVLGRVTAGWPVMACLGLAVLPFWPAVRHLAMNVWDGVDHAHGPLIVLIAMALAIGRARHLPLRDRPDMAAVGLLLAALSAGLLSRFGHVEILQYVAVIASAWLATAVVYGWRGAQALAFPFGFLVFAIPLLDSAVPVLQTITIWAISLIMPAIGIPTLVEGEFVTVPAGSFHIEPGCAGLHFFVVSLAGGLLYAYVYRLGLRRGLLAVGLAVALGIVTNWLRIAVIVWRGNETAMQSTLILDGHYGFGWTVFAIATVAYFVAMHRWTPLRSSMSVTTPCAAIAWAPIACVAVLCGVAALHAGWKEAISERWVLSVELLDAGTGWDRAEGESSLWTPGFSGPQAEATAQYRQGDAVVTWYSALYGSQGPGQKLIGHGSSLAGPGWTVRSDRLDAGTNRRRVAELQSDDGERVLVKYWYCIGSSGTIALREVKWLEARQWLYPRQPSRVVAVGARCGGDCEGADALLERFLAAHADSVSDTQHVAHSRS